MELPEHARVNREAWNVEAAHYVEPARRDWAAAEIGWGIWHVPEAEVGALAAVAGLDVVELGCGTAYLSAWLTSRTTSSPRRGRCRPSTGSSSR
jgi:hypothetical protein